MSDAEIVELYRNRDERAIQVTMEQYRSYLMKIAMQILGDEQDAEECVNDTWFKAWNSMPTHRPALLAPYLAKLTRWLALTRLRKRNALRRGGGETPIVLDELAEVIPGDADPEKQVEMKELGEALRRFVAGLEDTEARIFLARCWYMTGVKEIAEKYGITPGNVSTTLHRTRRKLQNFLKEEGLC